MIQIALLFLNKNAKWQRSPFLCLRLIRERFICIIFLPHQRRDSSCAVVLSAHEESHRGLNFARVNSSDPSRGGVRSAWTPEQTQSTPLSYRPRSSIWAGKINTGDDGGVIARIRACGRSSVWVNMRALILHHITQEWPAPQQSPPSIRPYLRLADGA